MSERQGRQNVAISVEQWKRLQWLFLERDPKESGPSRRYRTPGGLPIKVVAETLGHSRPSITIDTYVHALPCQERMAADAMDKLFKSA